MTNNHLLIVTGATGGIGSALILTALQHQCKCCAVVRNEAKLSQIISDQESKLLTVLPYTPPPTAELKLLLNQVCFVTLVSCAFQIQPISHIVNFGDQEVEDNIHDNLTIFVQLVSRIALLCKQKSLPLNIVNLDSGAAYRAIDGWSLYSAGKAYADMFLQTLAIEEPWVSVVLYDPGVVDTGMQETIRNAEQNQFSQVKTFKEYYANNLLHSPQIVAADIYRRYVQTWCAESLREKFI